MGGFIGNIYSLFCMKLLPVGFNALKIPKWHDDYRCPNLISQHFRAFKSTDMLKPDTCTLLEISKVLKTLKRSALA
jgi:hypothetical protein